MEKHASAIFCCCFVLVMTWLCSPISCNESITCLPEEREALLSTKDDLFPAAKFPYKSWKGFNCCEWDGVECSRLTSHVIKLHLSCSNFSRSKNEMLLEKNWEENWEEGPTLSPHLFRLRQLEYLDLSFNGLIGVIPAGFFSLRSLRYLDMSFNYFEGEIPKGIGSFVNLTHLNLQLSGFNGTIPNQLGNLSHLQFLDLSSDSQKFRVSEARGLESYSLEWIQNISELKYLSLSGVPLDMTGEKFGACIAGLHNLHYLEASGCQLSGSLPTAFLNLTSLAHIDLSDNWFSSAIPLWLGNMTALVSLRLYNNALYRQFPLTLSRLPRLQDLDLSGLFTGNISEILAGEWPHLTTFSLYGSNNVTGCIPHSLGNISSLVSLQLSYMLINGSIPPSVGNLSALRSLDLSSNQLSGDIPMELGGLSALHFLDLSYNQLSGDIPVELDGLSALHSLDLSYNQLSGDIPVELGGLSSLQTLDLAYNHLNGSVPSFVGRDIKSIDLSSNNLQGDVFLDSFQNSTKLRGLDLSHNYFTVHISPQWKPKSYFEYLSLASCNITDILPEFISAQYMLGSLDLSNNRIYGRIPSWLGELPNLYALNLSYNCMEGQFPLNLNLGQYDILDVHNNMLNGSLPISSSFLQVLDLSCNAFTGMIPVEIGMLLPIIELLSFSKNDLHGEIPSSIGQLQYLEVLDLSGNKLSGVISSSITDCSRLKILNLANTSLTGQIPSNMGRLWNLQSLYLNDNMLLGNLPSSLFNCSMLHILDVGNNNLSGNIPDWLGKFDRMMILVLRANHFQGHIPKELGNLSSLHVLDISQNNLTGFIPRELGKLVAMVDGHVRSLDNAGTRYYYKEQVQVTTKDSNLIYMDSILLLMTCIDLSDNELQGKIPSGIGKLKGLHALNMSRNNLTGGIPSAFGMMEQLESLDLSCNKLDGKIPIEMLQASYLAFFNVSHNMLYGKIPTGGQFSTFDPTFFSGNPGLCGLPLNNTCTPKTSPDMTPGEDDKNGEEEIPWHWYVEWAVAYAAGFWGVFAPLFVNKGWRRRYFQVLDEIVINMLERMTNQRYDIWLF